MIQLPTKIADHVDRTGISVSGQREVSYGTQYYLHKGDDRVSLTVYRTGKVQVQGNPSSKLKESLETIAGTKSSRQKATRTVSVGVTGSRPALDGTPRLGIDEAGKGEYFGPLVMAGARILNSETALRMQEIGVRDSKDLSVPQAIKMSEQITAALGEENVFVVALAPKVYERRRSEAGNVNLLLGEVSVEIVGELKPEVELVVVDEFATAARSYIQPVVPSGVRLEVRKKADRDDAAVAAASILARARYLEELELLSRKVGFELPRGSNRVLGPGRRVVLEKGRQGLDDVAKVSFSTTEQIMKSLGQGWR